MINRDLTYGGHALICGTSGSGKTYFVKKEIVSLLATRKDVDIIVVDTERDYKEICNQLEGTVIDLTDSKLNPFDIYGEDKRYYIANKADEITALIKSMIKEDLKPEEIAEIERATNVIYTDYFDNIPLDSFKNTSDYYINRSKSPCFEDFYNELRSDYLKLVLEVYLKTNLNGHSEKVDNRFTVYDLSRIPCNVKNVMYHVCLMDIMNRVNANYNKKRYTYVYLEDLQCLLQSPTMEMLGQYIKYFRTHYAVLTGIGMFYSDFIESKDCYNLLNNITYLYLFNQIPCSLNKLVEKGFLPENIAKNLTNLSVGQGYVETKHHHWHKFHINSDEQLKKEQKDAYYKGFCYNKNFVEEV